MVEDQPLILSTDVEEKMELEDEETGPRYNLRKLSELPYHLIRSEMWNEFVEVRINICFMLLKTRSLDNAIREFSLAYPSWCMSHYTMLYKNGERMRDFLGLFVFIVV